MIIKQNEPIGLILITASQLFVTVFAFAFLCLLYESIRGHNWSNVNELESLCMVHEDIVTASTYPNNISKLYVHSVKHTQLDHLLKSTVFFSLFPIFSPSFCMLLFFFQYEVIKLIHYTVYIKIIGI